MDSVKESLVGIPQYDTKNYLKSGFIDDQWIEALKTRNGKRGDKLVMTSDQKKLIQLKNKIAK